MFNSLNYTEALSSDLNYLQEKLIAIIFSTKNSISEIETYEEIHELILEQLELISTEYNLNAHIKRFLYKTYIETDIPFDSVEDKDFKKIVNTCIASDKNSDFKTSNITSYVSVLIDKDKCYDVSTKRLIEFAILTDMPIDELNKLLVINQGRANLNYLEINECIASYVLINKLGYNKYLNLKESANKKFNIKLEKPTSIIKLLNINNTTKQIVDEFNQSFKNNDYSKSENDFLEELLNKPLVDYSKVLTEQIVDTKLEDINIKWKEALEEIELLSKAFFLIPDRNRSLKLSTIEKYLKGFRNIRKTPFNTYKNIYENLKKDTGSPYFLYNTLIEEILNNNNIKNRNWINDKWPKWIRPPFKSALNTRTHTSIVEQKKSVNSNNIVLLKLWESSIIFNEKFLNNLDKPQFDNYIFNFIKSTNTILEDCGMNGINYANPFHSLAVLSICVTANPLDTFMTIIDNIINKQIS